MDKKRRKESVFLEVKPEERAPLKIKLLKKLNFGTFGEIYLGEDKISLEKVAVKIENLSSSFPQLVYESRIYKQLQMVKNYREKGVPKFISIGTIDKRSSMAVEVLDKNLQELLQYCSGRFNRQTTLSIGLQIIETIEFLHSLGIVHRDIKPENFMTGLLEKNEEKRIFVVDFGLSKQIFSKKKHIEMTINRELTGTARYASIANHKGLEPTRRDDLESIAYLLIYFIRGHLPWQDLPGNTREEKFNQIYKKKVSFPVKNLCEGIPKCLEMLLVYSKGLKFEETPNYSLIKNWFRESAKEEKLKIEPPRFEWIKKQKGRSISRPAIKTINEKAPIKRTKSRSQVVISSSKHNNISNDKNPKGSKSIRNLFVDAKIVSSFPKPIQIQDESLSSYTDDLDVNEFPTEIDRAPFVVQYRPGKLNHKNIPV